ncbi:MAG: DUF4384 domain-containing protein [Bacteroidales bacterium]|nr:DUF4384 domain-containing protein [Bacteroidales bacterium]
MLTTSGKYTYYAPSNITLEKAKAIALQRLKTQLIADSFGTTVSVTNSSAISNINGDSKITLLSIGESEVKGEWLETIGEPKWGIEYKDDMQVVTVSVRGRIREIVSSAVAFESRILRNGTEDKFESDTFKDNDEFYITFQSPVDGFVAIYLYDMDGVYRLLPTKNQKDGSQVVESGEKYIFFEKKIYQQTASDGRIIESVRSEYVLTCDDEAELNRIYVVFSPNRFSHPVDDLMGGSDVPANLSFDDFQRWLSRCRRQDKDMVLKTTDISISK